ncbi:alpha-hydroxy-acid oxidizing enzyme [Bordetella genomosp. 9]|uniref:alpha-hydroxy acid oxidase n=1 Tax=Bordetella genomosp. 9 TaxID=1416803 RepID=UPI000A293D93|nr:alpha-hydroxy acid oxidase [Bordetella genomosp. 9]ARP91817.1 alpha-hydroxy-acid oxidizing enzyme [Bordetella genomosp. 9]
MSDQTDLPPASFPQPSPRQRARARAAHSIEALRELAARTLPRAIFDFYDGGAETESTLRGNREAIDRLRLLPRYLVDVSHPDTGTQLLGRPAAMPLAVAPTGAIGYGWPFGDVAIARAAGDAGVPYALPTSSTSSIERVAREAPHTRLWFQSYMLRKRDFTFGLISRAHAAGYEALIITIDMPTGGKRERDLRNDFGLPFRFTPRNVLDFGRRPGWVLRQLRAGLPALENMAGFVPDAVDASTIASSVGKNYDPAFVWEDLARIRDAWPRKLLIKGVLHPEDARRAAQLGADGVIVSNHGGRQLDGAVAALDALPGVAHAVGGRIPVFVDGGVRRGTDIVKALALGAGGVLVGRPMLYGVSVAGQAGAERALFLFREELIRTLKLTGVARVQDIDATVLHAVEKKGSHPY